MNINWKKIGLIILFLAVTILLAIALYFTFFRKSPVPVVIPPTPTFPGGLPTIPGGGVIIPGEEVPPGVLPPSVGIIVPPEAGVAPIPSISVTANGGQVAPQKLVDTGAQFVNLASDGQALNYYDSTTGLFSKINPDGSLSLISSQVFRDLNNATWAPSSDKAVLEFQNGSKMIYNFATRQSYEIPSQFTDFSFSPDSKKIAAKDMKTNEEERWLVTVDDRGGNKQFLEHLGDNADRVKVQWNPNDKIIGTSAKSIDNERSEVIFLTKDGTKLGKAIVQGRDLRYDYSEDGNRMVYSVWNPNSNFLPTLWVTSTNPNNIDQGRVNTGLNTWADKCTYYQNTTIYCAVPKQISQYSGILPSNNDSPDDIYQINPDTGVSVKIAEPVFPVQIQNIKVSADGSTLFYTEQDSGAVNKIKL